MSGKLEFRRVTVTGPSGGEFNPPVQSQNAVFDPVTGTVDALFSNVIGGLDLTLVNIPCPTAPGGLIVSIGPHDVTVTVEHI